MKETPKKKEKKPSDLSRLLAYAGPRRPLTALSQVLAAASAALALMPLWYIWRILREVLETAPDFSRAVHLASHGRAAVIFSVAAMLVYIAGLMCSHLSAFRVATNLRIALSRHIATLPMGQIERFGSGKLRRTICETSGAAETYLAHQLPDRARAMTSIAGLFVLLFVFDWRLGALSLVPIIIGILCMLSMTGKSLQEKMKQYQNALADMANEAVEYVRGIPVVKTFGQTVYSFARLKKTIDNYEDWTVSYTRSMRAPMTACTLAINGVFAFLILGAFRLSEGGVSRELILNLLFYIILTPMIVTSLTRIMYMSENGMIVADALARIDEVFACAPMEQIAPAVHPADASIEFSHVTFRYDEGEKAKDALRDISLRIESGQTAALVGPSGGGKSTTAELIARFFDPQEGKILIGGADARAIDRKELADEIAFVFQNAHILKGTIADNVRLARPNATDEEVLAALRKAQCMDIVEKFPDGIRTRLGTNGVHLSGGECQRIAIARAFLKDAPIVVLDEATAFADPDNEVRVQKALAGLAHGRTIVMIAHRLSTVAGADRIFVLDEGRIVQSGAFDDLTREDGLFRDMWQQWQTSASWNVAKEG